MNFVCEVLRSNYERHQDGVDDSIPARDAVLRMRPVQRTAREPSFKREQKRTRSRFLAERGYTRQTQSRARRRDDEVAIGGLHQTGATPFKQDSTASSGRRFE